MIQRELTRKEKATICNLVKSQCANYDKEYGCLPLDCPCYMIGKCWTGAYCKYFCKAVLPLNPELEASITNPGKCDFKICPVCGGTYSPNTSQVYCSDICRQTARRASERMRKRKRRWKG